ncbi:hypothetical protein [Hydrogenivirga sp. 128-5-R1-1]|uniref:hypothetical protein n=1 Tax=Hydrogenivirga sp. 128-5-R1-1 TaxID=392423 RepID=UPI00015EF146|nr:hypothetical protein [Hydrogenivirga sp. 128-5-R1-1]EDP74659.1 hypothetical protein HG1285_14644 [Hydrogenivirga sp. 128-5-R1-1]
MGHLIPVRDSKRDVRFILGRVIYPKTNPKSVRVKVIKPGEPKVVVGKRGVYVLEDTLAEKVIREAWNEYLKRYKEPGSRSGKEVIDRPVEITESFLRDFLKRKGVGELFVRGFISFALEGSDVEKVLELANRLVNEPPARVET